MATSLEELRQVHEKTRRSYNLAAEKYFEDFKDEMKQKEYDRAFLDEFSSHFGSESIICDVGCGPGHITRYVHNKGLNVFGGTYRRRLLRLREEKTLECGFKSWIWLI